jgi:hypothetical protein
MQDVQRLFGWMAGLVSIAALARVLARRRRRETQAAEQQAVAQDPAEELRRKLSETREAAVPTEPAGPSEPTETLEDRRSRVHAKAQEAIEAMQDAPE